MASLLAESSTKTGLSNEEFIKISKKVHGDFYNYDETRFLSKSKPVYINCPKHGVFRQIASRHLMGKGCPKCGMENRASSSTRLTTEEFVRRAQNTHGDFYNYSKSVYTGASKKLTITCPLHGDFEQQASQHISGAGCPTCGAKLRTKWLFEKLG